MLTTCPPTLTLRLVESRLAWRGRQKSTTIVVRLRTVNMYLPQPVASCLRSPPASTPPPVLSPVAFPPAEPSPVDFVHARWKFEYRLTPPAPFVEWYMSRLRFFGPRLMAVCAHCRISLSAQLLEHAQIPELRPIVQFESRWQGPRRARPFPAKPQRTPCFRRAGALTWCYRCPGSNAPQAR